MCTKHTLNESHESRRRIFFIQLKYRKKKQQRVVNWITNFCFVSFRLWLSLEPPSSAGIWFDHQREKGHLEERYREDDVFFFHERWLNCHGCAWFFFLSSHKYILILSISLFQILTFFFFFINIFAVRYIITTCVR